MIPFIRNSLLAGATLIVAPFASAGSIPDAAYDAEVIFLGELHDNPEHHETQAQWVAALQPQALVFEMLSPEAAENATPEKRSDKKELAAALGWEASGWPDFSMYFPIFQAAPSAKVFGAAIAPEYLRGLMTGEMAPVFDAQEAERFGLNAALAPEEQVDRETLQMSSHCDAMPADMMPGMVWVQRARDAALARAALEAVAAGHAPVVVITGNGHARRDWGAPHALAVAAPSLKLFALGQAEEGQAPAGTFDHITDAPAVDRGDPCTAFR